MTNKYKKLKIYNRRKTMSKISPFKTAKRLYFVFAALLAVAGCDFPDPFFVPVTAIEGVPATGTVGTPLTLTATVRPGFASNSGIVWFVADAGTTGASVSGNVINAAANGTAIIKATIANGKGEGKDFTQEFKIVFTSTKAAGAAVGIPSASWDFASKTITVSAVTAPANGQSVEYALSTSGAADPADLTWVGKLTFTNADDDIAIDTTYYIYARSASNENYNEGTASISEGITTSAPVSVTGVTLNKTGTSLTVGGTETLTATVAPANAANKTVTWSSSNTATATVNNGIVTAVAAGTANITVKTEDGGFTAACSVTVISASVPATGVTLNKTTASLTVGGTETLTATVAPANATNKIVTWESSNTAVATVSGGMVTAVSAGTADITVTTADGGFTATCSVTVTQSSTTVSIEMVQIPGGSFEMGNPDTSVGDSDERPVHTVTLSAFSMGKYQVTQAQYQAVMGALPSSLTSGTNYGRGDNYPVYYVSWYDAIVFCNRLSMTEGLTPAYRISGSTNPADWGAVPTSSNSTWNAAVIVSGSTGYRLPTEAQWEYAAKGGDPTANGWEGYTYSGSNTVGDVAWYSDNSSSRTHEVGKKSPNGLGLYDMSGNVREWCWDRYGSYSSGAQTDPVGAVSGADRVARGGCWFNSAAYVRSAFRIYYPPSDRANGIGFRLVRPLP
jgi:formylglycine-generating enzyme required for sulfatase activity